jgi:hypothetical protein
MEPIFNPIKLFGVYLWFKDLINNTINTIMPASQCKICKNTNAKIKPLVRLGAAYNLFN